MLTIEQAVEAIRTATDWQTASGIRNDVAMEAMRRQRPSSDAKACNDAFYATWNDELVNAARQVPRGAAPVSGNWGD
jgi:hypothetical protein